MGSNPFAQVAQPHQLTIHAPAEMLDVIELRAEEFALAITRPVDAAAPRLIVIADEANAALLSEIAQQVGGQMKAKPQVEVLKLEPIDWVKKVQKDFPPVRIGRFYIYGTHVKQPPPHNALPLLIDAASAFGTGEHETTAGCLLALQREKQLRPNAADVLDMGCGTAILAIGAGRLWKDARLRAYDNDFVAVKTSQVNVAVNRMKARAGAWQSDGYRHAHVRQRQYDVVVANILARPLMKMAHAASARLKPGGTLILSGLLNSQEPMVLGAHRAQGLHLQHRIRRGRWSILVLKNGA